MAVPQLVREALEHELGPAEGKREHSGGGVDPWGDLEAWSDAAGEDTMDMLDEEEAAIGFSWLRVRVARRSSASSVARVQSTPRSLRP